MWSAHTWSKCRCVRVFFKSLHLLAYCGAVQASTELLSASAAPPTDEILAAAWACNAATGHFDELHGHISTADPSQNLAPHWQQFFSQMEARSSAELDARAASLQRQIRDNGVTYNVYADEEGPQRPWSLDLFPFIIDSANWKKIEAGILQRVQLLEAVMADTYGAQSYLKQGLLPPALVYGHPGYLRSMHGAPPAGGVHLHVVGFDLARGPFGHWWVVDQRCQAPSGLGYLLENRLAVSRQFAPAFQALKVQRLASTYRALMDSLKSLSPAGQNAHVALLTPGPYNETYFEHAYLARYLGVSLVEGNDLVVRDAHLFLKTMRGLVPVHCLLKRVDDQYLDPLELRPDSTLGVPGLLQALRAGNVLMANAPGSAFLESPALMAFLPAIARHVLQQELLLPALPSWWCGEHNAMQAALPQLHERTIKPTYPGSTIHHGFDTMQGHTLNATELRQLAERITHNSDAHTVQAYVPLSQMPTWHSGSAGQPGQMLPRSALLRVFAVSDGRDPLGRPRWRVLPGGLARVAGAGADMASMQRGGSSADVWALTQDEVDTTTLLPSALTPAGITQRKRLVTSRAAENLLWLGRYTERTENSARLARLTLECLNGEAQTSVPLMQWLSHMALANTLVLPDAPNAMQSRRVFEHALIDSLGSSRNATSVGFNLRALKMTAATVRERLSQEHWSMIVRTEDAFDARCRGLSLQSEFAANEALLSLKSLSASLAAITGAQTDRMTRDDGWRLLSIGRHLERLNFLAKALASGFQNGGLDSPGSFDAMLALFDSTITFRAQFQQSRDLAALLDLLVLDSDNPRSLAWVVHKLRGRIGKLTSEHNHPPASLTVHLPNFEHLNLATLCASTDAHTPPPALMQLLAQLGSSAFALSDAVSTTYFTHSRLSKISVGT